MKSEVLVPVSLSQHPQSHICLPYLHLPINPPLGFLLSSILYLSGHHPSIRPSPANGDVYLCCLGLCCRGGVDCPHELYICIIDKVYFYPASINVYLYNVSLCLLIAGWPCVLKLLAGRTAQEWCQLCLEYAGFQVRSWERDCGCMQTENWWVHKFSSLIQGEFLGRNIWVSFLDFINI